MSDGDPDFASLTSQVARLAAKVDGIDIRMTRLESRRKTDTEASVRLEKKVDHIDDVLNQAAGVLGAIRILASIGTIAAGIVAVLVILHFGQ